MKSQIELNLLHQALKSENPEAIQLALKIIKHPALYHDDPVRFCQNVLGVTLWQKQEEILRALVKHRRVMVKSANAIGKSFAAACSALWYFQTRDPSITIISAPTFRQVTNVIFKELKGLYKGPGIYDKLPRIELSHDHYITGFTAEDATSFQGIHSKSILCIFDEATGMDSTFWEGANGCLLGGDSYFLAILNPTDTNSQAHVEEMSGRWHTITISAFEHPNILAELRKEPQPIPGAISLQELDNRILEWCDLTDSPKSDDFEWRGKWYTPGPVAEARLLGQWPKQGSYSIFNAQSFEASFKRMFDPLPNDQVRIGCDVARFGVDFTCIHIRKGNCSLYHESYNGRDTKFTSERLKELATTYAGSQACKIPILIDDSGVGGGVTDQRGDFNFIGVNNSRSAVCHRDYPNQRTENYFRLNERLNKGNVDFSRLSKTVQQELKRQAMSVDYSLNAKGQRVADKSEEIKKKIGRSPDDLAATILCYANEDLIQVELLTVKNKKNRVII